MENHVEDSELANNQSFLNFVTAPGRTGFQTNQDTAMREIHDHKVNPANDRLKIEVTDEPGAGGANHRYEITGFDTAQNPSAKDRAGYTSSYSRELILFQNGPINEAGVNGITQEVLLAIIIDRLRSFQAGKFSCRENALALTKLEEAQHWLHARTRARMVRGVEGTHAA